MFEVGQVLKNQSEAKTEYEVGMVFPGEGPKSRVGHSLAAGVEAGDPELSWYIARVTARREARAEEGLIEAGFVVYTPCMTVWRKHGRKRSQVQQALFDGYLFVGVADDQTLAAVTKVEGVHNLPRFSERGPRAVSYAKMVKLLRAELAGGFDQTRRQAAPVLGHGDWVRVAGGPFSGFPAKVLKLSAKGRVRVLVTLFGRSSRITVDGADLELTA